MEGPPAAIVPVEKSFMSEMCAADLENFVHIRIYDKPNMKAYARIQYFLKRKHSSMLNKPLPEDEIKPGMFVVAEDNREYYRAKVLSKDNYGNINCYTVDDGTVCTVLPRQIFPINVTDLQAPAIVMKCRLEGLHLFNGLSYLQDAFTCIKIEEIEEDPYFQTTVLGMEDGIPVVRLETKGRQLTNLVQQWIPSLCKKNLAKTSSPVKATIVHAEEDGRIWFNTDDGNELLLRIEDTLQKIDPNAKPKSKKDSKLTNKEVLDFWKREYYSLPNAVFITRSKDDGVYYRAKVTKPMTKEKSEIQFIDYGNKEVVCRDSLILAMDVDENLAFIPPQCQTAKLRGISWINDLDDFWSYVPPTVDLLVIEKQNPKDTLVVEMFQPGTTTSINHVYLMKTVPVAEGRVKLTEQRDERAEVSTQQIATHSSKKIEDASDKLQDSGLDTLSSNELIDFVDLGSYKYGSSDWDFFNPISCPPLLPQFPENRIWDFLVTEQQGDGYLSLQSLENILGLKDLELDMNYFYDSVSQKDCPSLHVVELKNNGYYAMYSNSMNRWIRIKLLQLLEEEFHVCLIDYGRYEQLEAEEWRDVRPLKNTFLRLPMQGFTGLEVEAEDLIKFVIKSEQKNVPVEKQMPSFKSEDGKGIRAHVFSCKQDGTATFSHLKLVVLEYVQPTN